MVPAEAATDSPTKESTARDRQHERAGMPRAAPAGSPRTTATTSAESAKAVAIVATPWATPTAARTPSGRRACGSARSRAGSNGRISGIAAAGMCWVPIRLRKTQ